jgi:hypothetical protein
MNGQANPNAIDDAMSHEPLEDHNLRAILAL